ncbi:cupin domain-containing protein [Alteromonas pelagimontana]|uniref:Cupin domain-containing protein n=1 Tax=Alteromonas pelagimontana TaxID=1858656 RepID=A0A6M4MAX5_9ALTE|nr:cupin domain-containing protein [Alteromonas pelagimontana]QJR79725.1 cupin domain-containing protein [Alteromonas pelagimontana]
MEKYLVTKEEIETFQGEKKTHYLNPKAVRENKSLGELTGLTGLGVHIIAIEPGYETTEYHVHHFEDECVYILEGEATALVGDERLAVKAGDFLGYRAGGQAHTIMNSGANTLRCLVVGERLQHDVCDYPNLKKRLYRNPALSMDLVDSDKIIDPRLPPK